MGNPSLQALVTVRSDGTAATLDVYVYNHITDPTPTQIFKLQGLYKGGAKISGYNTVMTAEVDGNSSVNKNVNTNAALTVYLFREFKWSDATGTMVPVSFPGIFPDLTRYQAEIDQGQVNQGHDPWKLSAAQSATTLATTLLKWPTNAQATIVSGGGQSGSTSGRPEYVVSFNGNQALAFIPAPIGYPGIQPEDGSLAPVDSGLAAGIPCGPADNWYNPFSVFFFEGGTIAPTFTNSGQLFKQACGFSYHSIASNGGQQTDTQFSIDDRYEEVYDGNGQPGNYNANGTVVAGGEGNPNGGSGVGSGPYFGTINFAPAPVDASGPNAETPNAAAFLGPLPVICGGCSASAPGNDPVGGLGVGYQFHYADWRQASFDIAPLYGEVVADSRCGNPTNFGPFVCGGTLPANDDTANGHTATLVLGGYGELGVIVLAQFWPPTGYSAYTLTLSGGCPGDLQVSVPRNGRNQLGPFPGYTDNMGKATFGGQIFVIQAGKTLFTASANCFAVLSDSFTTSTTGVGAPNGQILITNPQTTSAFPGTITFP